MDSMDFDCRNFVLAGIGILSFLTYGDGAECRGTEIDSADRSWLELTRPLPNQTFLNFIGVRFCQAQPILLQIWERQQNNNYMYKLLWQRELQPDRAYLGQVQVFPVPDPFTLSADYRYGIAGSGVIPVETIFDTSRRTKRTSVHSTEVGVFSAGEIQEFTQLSRPVYFHVWFCETRECPSEAELIETFETELDIEHTEKVVTEAPPDSCRAATLHPAGGRVMLAEGTSFLPGVARALRLYLCDDSGFTVQLWEPLEGREYRPVWCKDIIPDRGSGGGFRRIIPLEEEEVVYLQPYYRMSLHVSDENKRIPVPSIFSYSGNVVFSERKKERFHRCDSHLFEEVAFPYDFRVQFCHTRDCSEGNETWTSDDPAVLEVLPSIECPEEPTTNETTVATTHVIDTTEYDDFTPTEATEDGKNPPDGSKGDEEDRDINRTKVKDGYKGKVTPAENELEVPNIGKSKSSSSSLVGSLSMVLLTLGVCWRAHR